MPPRTTPMLSRTRAATCKRPPTGAAAGCGPSARAASEQALGVDACGQRVVLDEQTARLDQLAHELGEHVVDFLAFLDLYLQQRARVGVERGFPELLRVHLAEAFVALHGDAFAPGSGQRLEQADR